MVITRAQREALKRLYGRQDKIGTYPTYREFRRRFRLLGTSDGCIIGEWCRMWIGIETDGYTHS